MPVRPIADVRPLRAVAAAPDAERAVLSAAILDGDAVVDEVRAIVAPDDMHDSGHAAVWQTILEVRDSGRAVDEVSVMEHLRSTGRLVRLGGMGYVAELVRAGTPGRATSHARIVRDAADARRIAEEVRSILTRTQAPDEIAAQLEERVAAMRARRGSTDAIRLVDADTIFAPLDPPAQVVEGLARRGSLALLGAYGSSGKTWVALDALLAVGHGRPWLGRYPCVQGRAAMLDYESGAYEISRRAQAIDAVNGTGLPPQIEVACFPRLYVGDGDFAAKLEAVARGRSLVVIDSLAALSPGIDENTSAMRIGLDHMRRIAETTGCVFLVLVHAKKTGGDPDAIDPREIFRGSSAIFDAADVCIAITKRRDQMIATQTKARHGRMVEPFAVEIVDVPGGVSVRAVDIGADEPDREPSAADRFRAICGEVVTYCRSNPGASRSAIEESIEGGRVRVRAALDSLVEDGRLVEVPGARGARTYRPAGGST